MSHFYGTVQGGRSQATRGATSNSGLKTQAAGWNGAIETRVFVRDGKDLFEVWLIPWQGSAGTPRLLTRGELNSACGESVVERA